MALSFDEFHNTELQPYCISSRSIKISRDTSPELWLGPALSQGWPTLLMSAHFLMCQSKPLCHVGVRDYLSVRGYLNVCG